MADAGVLLHILRKIAGHGSQTTTQRYLHPDRRSVTGARDSLSRHLGVSTHSFRKTVATLIDDEGLSARIGADHLGHAKVSMTQDRYMSRGRMHPQVAELLDRAVVINDE
jgi:integrase